MGTKKDYKLENKKFLKLLQNQDGVVSLPSGVLYRVNKAGEGDKSPNARSIVMVHYTGKLVDGTIFDDTHSQTYPEAIRLTEVIDGWREVLPLMRVGDSWTFYIPYNLGYGNRKNGNIPAFSTLIFDVELLGIG